MMTKNQSEIVQIISDATTPLNAHEIFEKMHNRPDLSTIYRTLEKLVNQNLIQVISLFEGTKYFYRPNKDGHFIICEGCHHIEEFPFCNADAIQQGLEKHYQFKLSQHILLFKGLCQACQKSF